MIRIDNYLVDCTISEEPSYASEVTDHPVESGSDISDNIRTKPVEYNVEAIVSDTPRGVVALEPDRSPSAGAPLPSKDAYDRLVVIHQTKKLVEIISPRFGKLINMALTKLSPPATKDTGKALHFTATFKQIKFITNNRTTVRVAVPSTGAKKDLGTLTAKPSTDPTKPIYVLSIPIAQRAEYSKTFGAPLIQRFRTNKNSHTQGLEQLDCYNVAGTAARPDGWLSRGSDGLYQYTPLANTQGSSTTNVAATFNGKPVDYDYADGAWHYPDGRVATRPPPGDRWAGIQQGVPGPGADTLPKSGG